MTFPMFDRSAPCKFVVMPNRGHFIVYNVHIKGDRSGIALSMAGFNTEHEALEWIAKQN